MDPRQARDVLGVPPGASEADIERAFRRRARSAHPDAGGSADRFQQVRAARDALLIEQRRPSARVHVHRSPWRRVRRWLLRLVPKALLPRHLRRRGRTLE